MVRNLYEMGRELAFGGDFIGVLKRISVRNLKNIVFPSKNVVWRSKTTIFEKNHVSLKQKVLIFLLFPLFKGPGRVHMGPYGPEKSERIRKKIAFMGAFKGPCTLP